MNFDPLVSGNAFQNGGSQPSFYLDLERNGHSLKPRIQCLKTNMPSDLLDKMVVPMPGEARHQVIAEYVRKRSHAANTNCEMTWAKRTSNLSQTSS